MLFPSPLTAFFYISVFLQNFQMMLILLPKKEVDPGAQNLPDMEIGNEKDAVLIFKPHIR